MNDQKMTNALQWLSNRGDSAKTCSFLKELMTSEDADEVIHLWLNEGFTPETSRIDRVCQLMAELENLVDGCQKEALMLMAALLPIASPLYLHEVCDSIDLWHHELGLKMNPKYSRPCH